MKDIFTKVGQLIADGNYASLSGLSIKKPDYFNWVADVFEDIHVKERPNKTALLWTDGDRTIAYSFKELSDQSNQLLNFLRRNGIEQSGVMLTQLMLQPVNWIAVLAGIKGGLQIIPTATIMGANDLLYRFEKTPPKVVISDKENAAKIDEAEKLSGQAIPVKIICDGTRPGWYTLDDIAAESKQADAAVTRPDDTLFMFFTSGTTGMPKIVCHTHFSQPVGHLTTTSWIGLKETDIHYNISQPGWAKFAWSSFFAPWNVGATIFAYHTLNRFHAARTLELIAYHKITTLCAPPTVLRLFIQEDIAAYQFALRECVAAGEPLNPEIIEEWKEATGILIRDGFGQTESTCMVANLPGQPVKFGSMGKPMFLYDVVIADEEGNLLPVNEEGTICIRMEKGAANGIFKEYLYDKEKETQVFRKGLYFTGDKAYKDKDGYIWFIGRDDDVIKSSDYRIGPFEVESALLEHPAVLESAVIGSPHPVKGFEIKAFIVLSNSYAPTEALAAALFAFSREQLAAYKMPRILQFVEELPKTISGKIRRIELRAQEMKHKTEKIPLPSEYYYIK